MSKRFILIGVVLSGCGAEDSPPCQPAPGTICTVAGTGISGFYGDGASALTAEMYAPMDITFGPDGSGYILDWNNHRIRALRPDGTMATIAGNGQVADGPADVQATESALNHPTHLAFDAKGDLFIAAWHNSRLKRIDMTTGQLSFTCGTGKRAYGGDGGPAKTADLDLPVSIVFDSKGHLIFMDQANQILRKVDDNDLITRIAGQCIIEPAKDSLCASGGAPVACGGPSNKLTCQDKALHDAALAKDPTAPDTYCKVTCTGAYGGDGESAMTARFNMSTGQNAEPTGRIAIDAKDNLYVADTYNNRVRRIDAVTNVVTTIAGNGEKGFDGDGGPAHAAQLNYPTDVEVGEDGSVYIADTNNHCIRVVDPSGTIATLAGVCGKEGFAGDGGDPKSALLSRPFGVELKGQDVYIVDSFNHRIRVVTR